MLRNEILTCQHEGNKPPWTLPAKGKYSGFETTRAKKYFGATHIGMPKPFPAMTLLVSERAVNEKKFS